MKTNFLGTLADSRSIGLRSCRIKLLKVLTRIVSIQIDSSTTFFIKVNIINTLDYSVQVSSYNLYKQEKKKNTYTIAINININKTNVFARTKTAGNYT